MRLYYMTQLDVFENHILPEQQIRISTFDKVNDPFELVGQVKNGNRKKHEFAWLKEYWTKVYGFISFIDNWRSPLMWAHYASNHTGVCLGIDVKIEDIKKIKYLPARSIININFQELETAIDEEIFKNLASTKFDQWSYENEFRLFRRLDYAARQPRPDFFYEQFTPEFELREVILGARCSKSPIDMQKKIFATTDTIVIKKARPSFNSFDIVENLSKKKFYIYPRSNFSKSEIKKINAERYALAYEKERAERKQMKINI